MTEQQKQAIADLKIKLENGVIDGHLFEHAGTSYIINRLIEATPEADPVIQNGEADNPDRAHHE